MAWKGFGSISPRKNEQFEEWYARASPHLPHLPRCVAEQWVHRYWGHPSPYTWLPLGRMRFEKQRWALEQILKIGVGHKWGSLDAWSGVMTEPDSDHRTTWLGKYMLAHSTWPVPIIVLNNQEELKDPTFGKPLARFHLIEGHRRLTYVRSLATIGSAAPKHDIWLTTLAEG